MGNKMIKCKTCGADIAASARVCPACGAKNSKPIYKRWWFWVIAVIFLFSIVPGKSNSQTATEKTSTVPVTSVSNTQAVSAEPKADDDSKEETQSKNDSVPTEYKNALKKVKGHIVLLKNNNNNLSVTSLSIFNNFNGKNNGYLSICYISSDKELKADIVKTVTEK